MPQVKFSLILPCYNESQHFETSAVQILNVLKKLNQNFEIIFVDDFSQDNTRALIKNFVLKNPKEQIKVILHKKNEGRGKSVTDGINCSKGEFVGFIDIDCEISPKYIPQFIKRLKQDFDIVTALRTYKLDLSNALRAILSRTYSILVSIILKTNMPDTEAGYKFFRRRSILPILPTIQDHEWFWDTEIMVRAEKKALKIEFINVLFHRRKDKNSTVKIIPDTVKYLKKLIRFRIHYLNRS